ncbi:MAG: glycosyltransferase family 4 protein [Gammaproteobacteria bacterium]|nr:glycosyltransferase family 4 protein [Gammaproteobacteria bacterium]
MRILLINHYAGSPEHGMEYRPYFMAQEWRRAGHRVRIVAASESHVRSKRVVLQGDFRRETIDGIEYVWLKTPSYKGNGAARAMNIFRFVWQLYRLAEKVVIDGFKPDAVIASSTYPLDIYPAHHLASGCAATLVWEVHDLWPLSPIELSGMSVFHPFIMLMQHAENRACRLADKVVSMLPYADRHLLEHGMVAEKYLYVPNGIHADAWHIDATKLPESHATLCNRLRREGRFLVCYAGAHGLANALQHLVSAAALSRDLPVSYILVGQGAEKEALQQQANSLGLDNIHFLDPVPRSAIPALLDRMDLLYIGLQRQSLFRFGISPNKLMDYMMAAKPIVQAIEAGNDMVGESGCGFTVTPEDPQAIADAVRSVYGMSESERSALGQRGRSYVSAQHDYPVLAQRFLEAMQP